METDHNKLKNALVILAVIGMVFIIVGSFLIYPEDQICCCENIYDRTKLATDKWAEFVGCETGSIAVTPATKSDFPLLNIPDSTWNIKENKVYKIRLIKNLFGDHEKYWYMPVATNIAEV
jgi:hypothetical protein